MKADLFILDDHENFRYPLELLAQDGNVPYVSFSSGVEALAYLQSCRTDELPEMYLVDMRIPGSEDELRSPLDIFYHLEERGRTKKFYFMTSHVSAHDEEVQVRTSANMINKSDIEDLFAIIQDLQRKSIVTED